MNSKRTLLSQVIKALAVVMLGATVITCINVSIEPHSKPYYAVIASKRVDAQLQQEAETGDKKHDSTNSGAGSK